ncbi:MAG: nucleotidyltransferase domain-containing protein [Planctomycetota bacterium]
MTQAIWPHQRRVIDRYVEHAEREGEALAVIMGGSIAKGWHAETSDVDLMVFMSNEDYKRRRADGTICVWAPEFADYEGGAADIKHLDVAYLEQAAASANEPTRAAFVGATVEYARGDPAPYEALVQRIATYPREGVDDRIASYIAQVVAMRWYAGEAHKRSDEYLGSWCATRAVLFGCRAVLALNRKLYPFHKWLLRAAEECERKPDGLVELARTASREGSIRPTEAFCDAVLEFTDWPGAEIPWAELYIRDTEQRWMRGQDSLEDA